MSRATCRRRIGIGISSPLTLGKPRPSQRAKTVERRLDVGAEREPPCKPLRDLTHRRESLTGSQAGVGNGLGDH